MKAKRESAEPAKEAVAVGQAKGRPMLTWVGKRPLSQVTAFPAQHVETFAPGGEPGSPGLWKEWPAAYPKGGLLFHGDNKEVLAHLLANGFRGKVDLVYIDPPFDSGADYVRQVSLRGAKGKVKVGGEEYSLGEQIQYTDIWANDNYLQFMYERLLMLKSLLSPRGSLYLHLDESRCHYIKALLDEVFGPEAFQREIIWDITVLSGFKTQAMNWIRGHDTLLFYAPGGDRTFNKLKQPHSQKYIDMFNRKDSRGRPYLVAHGMKRYLDEVLPKGKPFGDVWGDIMSFQQQPTSSENAQFPTQKPEALLERIIQASSHPGDLVLDCFIGSGTTAAVAQKLGRRWIGCDINKGAVQTKAKRLQTIIREQCESMRTAKAKGKQGRIPGITEEPEKPSPTQSSFTVWRVNDYDLAIQHNEAVHLACEHVGIQRSRTDSYFDGTLGKSLAKIIPFGHPLTPLDLEELKRELDSRPSEDRAVTLVCLGMELAAKSRIEEWNRLRKEKDFVHRIEVIELRTDPKYGRFIRHQPAKARVKVSRKNQMLTVEIQDFISPTILARLEQQAGILKPRIHDWRAMVDCVMIDPAYDGRVFKVALADVPLTKAEMVKGQYELPAPPGKTSVAIKVVDMLGEEVLVVQ